MARIRTIKPEFWSSPGTAKASPAARLLYIAMWNWADDYGIGTANMKELAAFAFPNDTHPTSTELPSLCKEVADCFDTVFYTVRGRPYFAIPTWEQHQRTERRAKGRNPGPGDPDAVPDLQICPSDGTSDDTHGTSVSTQGISLAGTEEQRNRGTEEELPPSAEPRTRAKYPAEFDEFWTHYPRKVGKDDALKAWLQARRKTPPTEIVAGVQRMTADPNLPEERFIPHPATWLRRGGWDDAPYPPRNGSRASPPSTTDQRVQAGLDLARKFADQERLELGA